MTTLPPAPDIPGPVTAETLLQRGGALPQRFLAGEGGTTKTADFTAPPPAPAVNAAIAAIDSPASRVPEMEMATDVVVTLPCGVVMPDGSLTKHARVRELIGYDEEKLSRMNPAENYGRFITRLLELGVEEIGNTKPDTEMIRSLLMGDRDALVLGIRQATYGRTYEFEFTCTRCNHASKVSIDLVDDIPVTEMEDPTRREFEIPETRRRVQAKLLDGVAQEAFSQDRDNKTPAEIATAMLVHSILAIDGNPVGKREADVLGLSSHDRAKTLDFLGDHQSGPKVDNVMVNCATCEYEYPISLGLGSLFRF